MGRTTSAGDLIVEYLIDAGPRADHQKSSFAPDAEFQWAEMARLHQLTFGKIIYLGDWHTHPGHRNGRLSPLDLDALSEILFAPQTLSQFVIFAILFGGKSRWRWSVHMAKQKASTFAVQNLSISHS